MQFLSLRQALLDRALQPAGRTENWALVCNVGFTSSVLPSRLQRCTALLNPLFFSGALDSEQEAKPSM
jgi:hypothetical protein